MKNGSLFHLDRLAAINVQVREMLEAWEVIARDDRLRRMVIAMPVLIGELTGDDVDRREQTMRRLEHLFSEDCIVTDEVNDEVLWQLGFMVGNVNDLSDLLNTFRTQYNIGIYAHSAYPYAQNNNSQSEWILFVIRRNRKFLFYYLYVRYFSKKFYVLAYINIMGQKRKHKNLCLQITKKQFGIKILFCSFFWPENPNR